MRPPCGCAVLLALSGCLFSEKDVVARRVKTSDAGTTPEGGSRSEDPAEKPMPEAGPVPDRDSGDAVTASPPLMCSDGAEQLVAINKEGNIVRVQPEPFTLKDLGASSCTMSFPAASAVDRTGTLWLSTQTGGVASVEPGSLVCKLPEFEQSKISAMAFVFDPSQQQELLYLIADGILTAVDPTTLSRAPIGPLNAQVLTGTARGELYAIDELDETSLSIAYVNLGSGTKKPAWTVKRPNGWYFGGGTAHAGGFVLAFENEIYRFLPGDSSLRLLGSLPAGLGSVVTLASAICGGESK
jgi:hypothetical protein